MNIQTVQPGEKLKQMIRGSKPKITPGLIVRCKGGRAIFYNHLPRPQIKRRMLWVGSN